MWKKGFGGNNGPDFWQLKIKNEESGSFGKVSEIAKYKQQYKFGSTIYFIPVKVYIYRNIYILIWYFEIKASLFKKLSSTTLCCSCCNFFFSFFAMVWKFPTCLREKCGSEEAKQSCCGTRTPKSYTNPTDAASRASCSLQQNFEGIFCSTLCSGGFSPCAILACWLCFINHTWLIYNNDNSILLQENIFRAVRYSMKKRWTTTEWSTVCIKSLFGRVW